MIKDIAMPLADPKAQNMIMVTSFNEWYEDTQIEPTSGKAKSPTSKDNSKSGNFSRKIISTMTMVFFILIFCVQNLGNDQFSLSLSSLTNHFSNCGFPSIP